MAGKGCEAGCSPGSPSGVTPEVTGTSCLRSSWLAAQNRLLEMIASGASIEDVLHYLVRCIEAESDQALCSILLLREGRLWTLAAPSLQRSYNEAIHGVAIGPGVGSCGNTAYTGQPTIVEDIAMHPFWADYRELASQHGLRSCWSTPIQLADQAVLGTFAIYHRIPVSPSERDFALIRGATHIAGIALERQRNDDVLRRQAQELRDADRRKDVFLAALSHELRNPLAPILTTVQLLGRTLDTADPSVVRRGLTMIERQAHHLTRLIDDLLDLARVTEGKIALHKEPLEIVGLVQQAVDQMTPLIESRGHRLHLDVPQETILIYADSVRMVQVITNLLGNAAKYTPPGGDVWIAVCSRDDGLEISVRDSGIGISSDALVRIFDLYAQVDLPQAGMQGGLGIGLALVKGLVEKHGGQVSAASKGSGRGSQFRVWLPALPAQEKAPDNQAAIAAPPLTPPQRTRRVLVVDDNEDAAEMLAAVIETAGCTARLAASGVAALTMAAEWNPDLIFLDIGLPDLDGFEVARRLRAQSKHCGRLIALTGYGQPSDVARAAAAGFEQLLTKPAQLDALLAIIAAG